MTDRIFANLSAQLAADGAAEEGDDTGEYGGAREKGRFDRACWEGGGSGGRSRSFSPATNASPGHRPIIHKAVQDYAPCETLHAMPRQSHGPPGRGRAGQGLSRVGRHPSDAP